MEAQRRSGCGCSGRQGCTRGRCWRDALGDAGPAARHWAGAQPSSFGLPVTSNDFFFSYFCVWAGWPAGGPVASCLPSCWGAAYVCDLNCSAWAVSPALHAVCVSKRHRAALLIWLLYSSYCFNTFRHSTSVICLDVISSFVSANWPFYLS